MAEDYVTYELAVKLKEKGYPQRCGGKYDMIGACYFNDGRLYEDGCIAPVEDCFTAPTISQVLKWLREEHATHIGISLRKGWYFEIIQYEYYEEEKKYDCKLMTVSLIHDSYKEAAISGIEYTIYNLI